MTRLTLASKFLLVAVLTLLVSSGALASVTFNGTSGTLSAQAVFGVSGNDLTILLTNNSSTAVSGPADLLSALFFDISGASVTLTPVSAFLDGTSTIFNYNTCKINNVSTPCPSGTGANVGGEFEYLNGISGTSPNGANNGISSSGFNIFGNANFNGSNLDDPAAVDGGNFGLTSAGSTASSGNNGVTSIPTIHDSVLFTLSGLPDNFDLMRIGNVGFQYGTALGTDACINCGQGFVPEPSQVVFLVLSSGLIAFVAWRRKRAEA